MRLSVHWRLERPGMTIKRPSSRRRRSRLGSERKGDFVWSNDSAASTYALDYRIALLHSREREEGARMFNLIVSSGLENDRSGTIMAERVFEHTSDAMTARFKPRGQLDIAALCALPTIFMNEGVGNQVAAVGWLSRVELRGGELRLHYYYDPAIPRLTNAEIYALSDDLTIDDWEFSRNHWAVKDVDLFQILYQRKVAQPAAPTVFQLSSNPVNQRLVSMMMPFSGNFTQVYQTVRSSLEGEGYECKRADDFWLHAHIMQDIIELICTSKVVICDLSEKNPNVFYEVGIAHTLGKEVILIAQQMDDVPFDLRSIRCITYLNNDQGRTQLAGEILARLKTLG